MSRRCQQCDHSNEDWRPFCAQCGLAVPPIELPTIDQATIELPTIDRAAAPPPPAPLDAAGGWPFTTPPPRHGRSSQPRSGAFVALVITLCVALTGGGAISYYALTKTASPYPKQWDARIKPLADIAARLRGLTFKHPVRAIFHSDADFVRLVTAGLNGNETASATAAADREIAGMRSVGLADGPVNLGHETAKLNSASVLAYYSDTEKQIHIRGTSITVDLRVTLVHELTHALQDQYFDLSAIQRTARMHKTDAPRALFEGDAVWVEDKYVDELSDADQAKYRHIEDAGRTDATKATSSVPDIIVISQQVPYEFGPAFVSFLRNIGGQRAVDDAFRSPPMSEEFILDPIAYYDQQVAAPPTRTKAPVGATGYTSHGEFGAISWFSMLAERIDPHVALAAIDGWSGDAWWDYRKNNTTCVALAWHAKLATGRDAMGAALRSWRAAMPHPALISVSDVGDTDVDMFSCDPGTATKAVTHKSRDALALPLLRSAFAAGFAKNSVPPHTAWCAADELVKHSSASQLTKPEALAGDAFKANVRHWLAACRSASIDAASP